jgi:hypothetical protein
VEHTKTLHNSHKRRRHDDDDADHEKQVKNPKGLTSKRVLMLSGGDYPWFATA